VRLRKAAYIRFFWLVGQMLVEGTDTRPPTIADVEREWLRDTAQPDGNAGPSTEVSLSVRIVFCTEGPGPGEAYVTTTLRQTLRMCV
jgi:hypothetical protein